MRRRRFLAWILGVAGVVAGKLALDRFAFLRGRQDRSAADSTLPAPSGDALRFLTTDEALTLNAVLERMIPSNVPPGAPGARETRVLRYIDAQLPEPRLAQAQELVRAGLRALDEVAGSARFHELPTDRQDELLRRAQRGEGPFASPRFFQVVLTLALEGHWGDPRYGGNHDKLAWRWVGIDPGCEGGLRACR
jgi:gluconate 2-dehydrogenase gamma chain